MSGHFSFLLGTLNLNEIRLIDNKITSSPIKRYLGFLCFRYCPLFYGFDGRPNLLWISQSLSSKGKKKAKQRDKSTNSTTHNLIVPELLFIECLLCTKYSCKNQGCNTKKIDKRKKAPALRWIPIHQMRNKHNKSVNKHKMINLKMMQKI